MHSMSCSSLFFHCPACSWHTKLRTSNPSIHSSLAFFLSYRQKPLQTAPNPGCPTPCPPLKAQHTAQHTLLILRLTILYSHSFFSHRQRLLQTAHARGSPTPCPPQRAQPPHTRHTPTPCTTQTTHHTISMPRHNTSSPRYNAFNLL